MFRVSISGLLVLSVVALLSLGGCATNKARYDYTAYRKANPKSIVILPPINKSPDVAASGSVLATASVPVAEDGYYVFPVALVSQIFKENGLTAPEEIQQVPTAKLHEIFGADAALYINVNSYGASYEVVASNVRVSLDARLVDLRSGELLWVGTASASNQEGRSSNQGGIVGMLISAVVEQIANNLMDPSYRIGAIANSRLLSANPTDGLLYGPRSPLYRNP